MNLRSLQVLNIYNCIYVYSCLWVSVKEKQKKKMRNCYGGNVGKFSFARRLQICQLRKIGNKSVHLVTKLFCKKICLCRWIFLYGFMLFVLVQNLSRLKYKLHIYVWIMFYHSVLLFMRENKKFIIIKVILSGQAVCRLPRYK